MSSPLPDHWKRRVCRILASGDLKKIIIRQSARRDWSLLFPKAFDSDLLLALQLTLEQPNLLGNQVAGMNEEGEVYEFIFVHESRHVYSKINLCPDGTVIIIYSAHRPFERNHPVKNKPFENWERTEILEPVSIPTLDGKSVAETVQVKVQAWRNPKDGEIYLDGEALAELDRVKARHMGIMLPTEIKELREQLGVTQEKMADLLQIGEKSYCRWETGRERPSRSLNLLLASLNDGRIDVAYLESRLKPDFDWRGKIQQDQGQANPRWTPLFQSEPRDLTEKEEIANEACTG